MNKDQLKRYREELAGLSIREAARRSGISPQYISQLEMGVKSNPSVGLIQDLLQVYQEAYAFGLHREMYKESGKEFPKGKKTPIKFLRKAESEITLGGVWS